jgi:WD40 repeat protein/tetratricopeptide (TPR) repeat protein/tRNA A-37 threonylcarbamoyl transferase component Bud32
MGVIYRARQASLGRVVALKMIREVELAGPQERERFRREAEAAARLQHPNIVQVFEVGEHEGRAFFSMEYVEGGSLHQKLAGTPLPPREAAGLVRTLARAVHHAHQRGIIHRDLKPGNVLISFSREPGTSAGTDAPAPGSRLNDCIPKIADFGLAKLLQDEPGELATGAATRSGAILGTPNYMAPEQARGHNRGLGPGADLWALGAILYECLTGRPPFSAATVLETLEQVVAHEVVPPRQFQPRVPRDLETISLRCLQKDPARRYPSADVLADELGRFLDGRPIQARPVGRAERVWRWGRRNPVVAGLTALVALCLVAGSTVASILAVRMYEHADRADRAAAAATANAQTADQESQRARNEERTTRRFFYAAQMALIADAWDKGDMGAIQQMLGTLIPKSGQEDLRGPEWHWFWRKVHGYRLTFGGGSSPCHSVVFLDGGRTLLTGGPGNVKLWDAATGKEKATLLAGAGRRYEVRPATGGAVVVGWTDTTLRCWAYARGQLTPLFQTAADLKDPPPVCVVAPNGKALAVAVGPAGGPRKLKVWDLVHGKERFTKRDRHIPLAFTPDGKTLVAGTTLGLTSLNNILLFDATTGKQTKTWKANYRPDLLAGMFFGDARRLLTACHGEILTLWDVPTGKAIDTFTYVTLPAALAIAPDGKKVAAGPGYGAAPIRLWDVASPRQYRDLWGHTGLVRRLAFAPDGSSLAAACADGTVKVWDVGPRALQDARAMNPLPDPEVIALAFRPDSRVLATAGADHTLRLWDVGSGREQAILRGHAGPVEAVTFMANDLLASGSKDGTVRLWDGETGAPRAIFREPASVVGLAGSPDGRMLAVATWGAGLRLRDPVGGDARPGPADCPTRVHAVAFSPNGTFLAAACGDATVRVWEVATRRARHVFAVKVAARSVAFMADGRHLVADGDNPLPGWDMGTGQAMASPLRAMNNAMLFPVAAARGGRYLAAARGHGTLQNWLYAWDLKARRDPHWFIHLEERANVAGLAFSPDGRYLAAAHADGTVTLYGPDRGSVRRCLSGHANAMSAAAWSPDGTLVAEARPDFSVCLREVRSRRVQASLRGHTGPVTAVAFARDGATVVTGSLDHTVRVWDAATGRERRTFTRHRRFVRCVALAPDGRTIASGDGRMDDHGEVKLWDAATGREKATLRPQSWAVRSLAFSLDGRMLACGTGSNYTNIHGTLSLWDAATGAKLAVLGKPVPIYLTAAFDAEGHQGNILALAFSPDGRLLASGSDRDGTVRLWDPAARTLHGTLRGHLDGVTALAFAADGKRLVSTGNDGNLRLWDVPRLLPRGLVPVGEVTGVAFMPESGVAVARPTGTAEVGRAAPPNALRFYAQSLAGAREAASAGPEYQLLRMQFQVAQAQKRGGDSAAARATRRRAEHLARRFPGAEPFKDPVEPRGYNPTTLILRGNDLMGRGAVDEAILLYRQVIRLRPRWLWGHLNLGIALRRKGQIEGAIACFEEAIRLQPDDARAITSLGFALQQKGDLDGAAVAYGRAVRMKPDDLSVWQYLGRIQVRRKAWNEAAAAWRQAIHLRPRDAELHGRLGAALLSKGDLDSAAAAYREAVRLKPDYAYGHSFLGVVLARKKAWREAVTACREAVRLQPDHVPYRFNLGWVLRLKGDIDAALAVYRQAVRLKPQDPDVYENLWAALSAQGAWAEAFAAAREGVATFERLHVRFPQAVGHRLGLARSLILLAWLYANCPQEGRRDLVRAVALARRAIEVSPAGKAGACWGVLGMALYRMGDWRAALDAFEKFQGGDDHRNNAELFFLAMTHWRLGHREKARHWYDRAVRWMEENAPKDHILVRARAEAAALLR